MDITDHSPMKKALRINLDAQIYGTFAEIGAGQDVARHFFQAGKASQTVAKTMSAYDMTFSDAIYGKSGRYVSQERLVKMLDHEFGLLQERLEEARGSTTTFFAFADTVATSQDLNRCHGWMGIRFQAEPQGEVSEAILHVRLLDRFRLDQQATLGVLGVNLIEASFYHRDTYQGFLDALTDHLNTKKIEIDMISFRGPAVQHFDNRLVSLELVRRGLTDAVLFSPDGNMLQPSDALFKKTILIQRGTFRPVTNINVEITERGLKQMGRDWPEHKDIHMLYEMTMHDLASSGQVDPSDFLQRVDTLLLLGHQVLISNFFLFYGVKGFLRRYTEQPIGLVVGASHLEKIFDLQFYRELPGGILEAFSRLFDEKTRLYVFPFKSKEMCMTVKTFRPDKTLVHLYNHLVDSRLIMDIADCDDVDTSVLSQDIRTMLVANDSAWEKLVPKVVSEKIKAKKLFGLGSKKK